ncbi:hypothetical protein UFOVP1605_47 [uncultured Caudovirales phage]|uniref:Uncharacterized protein n=1 Tax=uncultured Caudovirales phage TaxID=2100421 RepID=A0A6J5SUN9_9CAUD|nr:hypothetical protein UFOVP1605_47 [uncultured Caudovirales phage]
MKTKDELIAAANRFKKEVDEILGFKTDLSVNIGDVPHDLVCVLSGVHLDEYHSYDLTTDAQKLSVSLLSDKMPF